MGAAAPSTCPHPYSRARQRRDGSDRRATHVPRWRHGGMEVAESDEGASTNFSREDGRARRRCAPLSLRSLVGLCATSALTCTQGSCPGSGGMLCSLSFSWEVSAGQHAAGLPGVRYQHHILSRRTARHFFFPALSCVFFELLLHPRPLLT